MARSRLSRIGRVLGLVCLAAVALPVVYAFGTYALLFGFYALWSVIGLVIGLFEGGWFRSPGDLRAFFGLGFWISLVLTLSAGTLYGIWTAMRSFTAMAFRTNSPRYDVPRRNRSFRVFRRWGPLLLVPLACGGAWLVLPETPDDRLRTHVTIYLDPAVVESGGVLVVAGIPVSEAVWRAIPPGDNPAMLDPANPKGAEVGPADRHFGAVVAASAAVVEFRYPEGGTYTFNIRPSPETETALGQGLATELVSIGSASMMIDPETGGDLDWPSINVVAVLGPGRDAGWARVAEHAVSRAFDEGVEIRHHEGVRTISMTEEQVQRLVVEPRD